MHAGLGRLHRIPLVVDGRGRAREIEDLVDLDEKRMGDVVPKEFEVLVTEEVLDVAPAAGEKIVDAKHLIPALEQLSAGETRGSRRRLRLGPYARGACQPALPNAIPNCSTLNPPGLRRRSLSNLSDRGA